MLSDHPHITNVRIIKSDLLVDKPLRRLVVDTDLSMPESGLLEENIELLNLHNYLEEIALHDFADFDEVEIRTTGTEQHA